MPPYNLCIHDRDFIPGEDRIANVVNAMEDSNKTILLISPASLASEWERFVQYNALWEGSIRGHTNYIIPVLYPGVAITDLPKRLKRAVRHVPVLRAGERGFWVKLCAMLDLAS